MGKRIRLLFWLLTAFFFAYDTYLWGGLEATPQIGHQLMKEAPFGSPLAATYMFLGRKIVRTIGQRDASIQYAAEKFPELVAHPEDVQNLAVFKFLAAQGTWGTICYYMAPVLLVLSFILHFMRQKQVKSLGT